MNILFEIADKDLMFIGLAFVALIIFATIIFYIVNKDNRVAPLPEDERFDREEDKPLETTKELTPEQQEAKSELERVFAQMSADLEASKAPERAVIDEFEREQEENAIISYQELIKEAAKNKPTLVKENPKTQDDVLAQYFNETKDNPKVSQIEFDTEKLDQEKAKPKEPKKFQNSAIISPIFGIQEGSVPTATSKESKVAYEEIKSSYDGDSNIDFLNSLKEFRKNL